MAYLPGFQTLVRSHSASGAANHNGNISVTAEGGAYKVRTPYNSQFVNQLKIEIPATARKWDNSQKVWYVGRNYGGELKRLIDECYSCDVKLPTIIAEKAEIFETTFRAEYVANCKQSVSNVFANGGWNARIPEKVLRAWFKQTDAQAGTYYGTLGIDEKATGEEIKKAYKRAARSWHPDVCREPNAREMFEEIKAAYDVLSNQLTRNKYDAGLFFEKMAKMSPKASKFASFVPVLRCGDLRVTAKSEMGILIVEEILSWEDITNDFGQVMITFWDVESFSVLWV